MAVLLMVRFNLVMFFLWHLYFVFWIFLTLGVTLGVHFGKTEKASVIALTIDHQRNWRIVYALTN